MDNFDLTKYLAEGKLYENTEEDIASKAVSVLKSYKGEVKGLEDYIKYLMNTSDDISSSIQAVADDMDRDNDAEDSLRRDLEKLSLAEGKLLKEDQSPKFKIDDFVQPKSRDKYIGQIEDVYINKPENLEMKDGEYVYSVEKLNHRGKNAMSFDFKESDLESISDPTDYIKSLTPYKR